MGPCHYPREGQREGLMARIMYWPTISCGELLPPHMDGVPQLRGTSEIVWNTSTAAVISLGHPFLEQHLHMRSCLPTSHED